MGNPSFIFDNLIGIIANAATAATFAVIAYQTYLNNKNLKIAEKTYEIGNQRAEKEKAVQLAEFYCNEIIPAMEYVSCIFHRIKIKNLLDRKIPITKMKNFDQTELNRIIRPEEQREIESEIKKICEKDIFECRKRVGIITSEEHQYYFIKNEINKVVQKKSEENDMKNAECEINLTLEEICSCIPAVPEEVIKNISLRDYYSGFYVSDFNNTVRGLLNKLEFFCMYFTNGIADDKTVYQSLHQTFLSTVQLLYFFIAKQNNSSGDKYYINIITLYNEWSTIQLKQKEKELEAEEKSKRGQEIVPKKINR